MTPRGGTLSCGQVFAIGSGTVEVGAGLGGCDVAIVGAICARGLEVALPGRLVADRVCVWLFGLGLVARSGRSVLRLVGRHLSFADVYCNVLEVEVKWLWLVTW